MPAKDLFRYLPESLLVVRVFAPALELPEQPALALSQLMKPLGAAARGRGIWLDKVRM